MDGCIELTDDVLMKTALQAYYSIQNSSTKPRIEPFIPSLLIEVVLVDVFVEGKLFVRKT